MATSGFDSSSDDDRESTTETPPLHVDWVDLSVFGYPKTLAISQLPGCRYKTRWRNLQSDMSTVANLGIQSVYVLLTRGELKKFRVVQLFDSYETVGIAVHHIPIPDGTVPNISTVMKFIYDLKQDLDDQHKILIHCYGGLGRSCLLVACFMMHLDDTLTPDRVIEIFRSLRGAGAIQTVKQYNFIHDFRKLREDFDENGDCSRAISR